MSNIIAFIAASRHLPINQNNIYFIINKGTLKTFEIIVFEDSVKKLLQDTKIHLYPVTEK